MNNFEVWKLTGTCVIYNQTNLVGLSSSRRSLFSRSFSLTDKDRSRGLMDSDGRRTGNLGSALPGDLVFFKKIMSREPTIGYSSRVYYPTAEAVVPFNWETQAGQPKSWPGREAAPEAEPASALSLGLPEPCMDRDKSIGTGSGAWKAARVWFWKMGKINILNKKKVKAGSKRQNDDNGEDSMVMETVLSNSEVDFVDYSSPRNSSSSPCSIINGLSSSPSSGISSMPAATDLTYEPLSCGPWSWSIAGIVITIARRV